MCTCSSVLKLLDRQIIFIFISLFMTISEGNIICPFIETLSFGSDINIQCNDSYLIINEINSEGLNWKFADQTLICDQNGPQKASVNQCGITRIGPNYLTVPLKSLENNEKACIYCRINYKSMAPVIQAIKSDEGQSILYTFNITGTGLEKNQSFEILWAKRVHDVHRYSYNYWFLQGCVDPTVKIIVNTGYTIIFEVDDAIINRAEFLIRRCNGTCRKYDKCEREQYLKEIDSNSFQTPDSIEKISCDSNCLNRLNPSPLPTMTHRTRKISSTSSTTMKPSLNFEQIIKVLIPVISIGILLSIILAICIRCIICKSDDKKHVYTKTSNADPDEHK